jgi:hypothetical protein
MRRTRPVAANTCPRRFPPRRAFLLRRPAIVEIQGAISAVTNGKPSLRKSAASGTLSTINAHLTKKEFA